MVAVVEGDTVMVGLTVAGGWEGGVGSRSLPDTTAAQDIAWGGGRMGK